MDRPTAVDVDDPTTWPDSVAEWVEARAEADASWIVLVEQEPELRALLAGYKVRTYHCTRLLAHEPTIIRAQGLRRLTPGLVADRLRRAREAGVLTAEQHDRLAEGHLADDEYRRGQVCLIVGRASFDTDPDASANLLEIWGGEAISFPVDSSPLEESLLRREGRPAIVVGQVYVDDRLDTFGDLARPFVDRVRGEPSYAVAHVRTDVPAGDVLDIWQPGHPDYDRHRDLPRR